MKRMLLVLLIVILGACGGTQKKETVPTLTADPKADLSTARIDTIYPLTLMPGTLVSVSGSGFGTVPGIVKIGDLKITRFLGWSDGQIWFRLPGPIAPGAPMEIGKDMSKIGLNPAPKGSFRLIWYVDLKAAQKHINTMYKEYGLDTPATFKPPLHIKGQWKKSGSEFGNMEAGWDGGSRLLMFNIPKSSIWISECVFTPDNVKSFDEQLLLFAFEDGDSGTRNLSSFESDAAFILKKHWAQNDPYGEVDSDPGVRIADIVKQLDSKQKSYRLSYPPTKK